MCLIVRDDLIPRRLVRAAAADWPGAEWSGWHAYQDGKRASRMVEAAPVSIRAVLQRLAESAPLFHANSFPDLSFYAAGLHELPPGVGLDWHRDAARHPLRPWRRTETAILYLDEGGALVFRGEHGDRIEPKPGRVVTFSPEENTEHMVEPSPSVRRSLTCFFYVVDPEASGSVRAEFNRA